MDFLLLTILLGVFMSGIALLERISSDFLTSFKLSENFLTKIGTVLRFFYFLILILLFFLHSQIKWITFWFLIVVTLICSILFFYFKKIKSARITNEDWLCFVEDMLLLMKAGKGFREALRLSMKNQPARFSSYYNRWIEHVVFLQQGVSLSIRSIPIEISRLCEIDQKPHEALARLIAWRDEIRITEKFRRRSGQALYSFRFQSIVVAVIYFAATIYSFMKYPIAMVWPFFLVSLVWLIIGGGVFFKWSRKKQWKV